MKEPYLANYSKLITNVINQYSNKNEAVLKAMTQEFPIGTPVRVVHYHGSYTGTIKGYDPDYEKLLVLNDNTGKQKWWHYSHVEEILDV